MRIFRGEIADTQCATNVHSLSRSHKEMLAKYRFIGATAQACAQYCVRKGGGDYVLQSGNKVYQLANSSSFEPYAGEKVMMRGTYDPKSNTITAEKVLPVRARHSIPTK